jgi:hypothetical protein
MTAAVLEESRRSVTVQENGETFEISVRNALIRAQAKSASKGNAYSLEHHLRRIEKAEKIEKEVVEASNAAAEAYIASCRIEIEAAQQAGKPIPEFLPHPDDIVIEPGKPYEIVGPASQEELEYYRRACALRDILLMSYTISLRTDPAVALCNVFEISVIDARLPQRMRLHDSWIHMSPYRRMSSTKLRKLIREASRELGVSTHDRV